MARESADGLGIAIDRHADLPVGVQLTWALRSLILTGDLPGGARLPALHRLAEELGINPNTVRAAYARLEHDGLLETRHGSGSFVKQAPDSRANLAHALASAAQAADEAGVSTRDVAAALYVGLEREGGSDPAARRRRQLRAEIAVLERSLSELRVGRRPARADDDRSRRPIGPRLLSAQELEAQRDHVLRQLTAAHAGGDPPQDPTGRPETDAPPQPTPARTRRASKRAPGVTMRVAQEEG